MLGRLQLVFSKNCTKIFSLERMGNIRRANIKLVPNLFKVWQAIFILSVLFWDTIFWWNSRMVLLLVELLRELQVSCRNLQITTLTDCLKSACICTDLWQLWKFHRKTYILLTYIWRERLRLHTIRLFAKSGIIQAMSSCSIYHQSLGPNLFDIETFGTDPSILNYVKDLKRVVFLLLKIL